MLPEAAESGACDCRLGTVGKPTCWDRQLMKNGLRNVFAKMRVRVESPSMGMLADELLDTERLSVGIERAVGRKPNIEKVFAKSFCKSKLFINFVATRGPNGH